MAALKLSFIPFLVSSSINSTPLTTHLAAHTTLPPPLPPLPAMSRPQQQPKPDDKLPAEEPAAATNGVETTTTSSLAPTTYIDPKADAVVVSDDGREFHVQSYMLKANS